MSNSWWVNRENSSEHPVLIPPGVSLGAEEIRTHVVVHAVYFPTAGMEMF